MPETFCVEIEKNSQNKLGLTISGGPPYCPITYVTQILNKGPASKIERIEPGDELLEINGENATVINKARIGEIVASSPSQHQIAKNPIRLKFGKLQIDYTAGYSVDVFLKGLKQHLVEHMSKNTADFLGLSRAVLVGDGLVKKLEHLERSSEDYKAIARGVQKVLLAYKEQATVHREVSDVFAGFAANENNSSVSRALTLTSESHRQLSKCGLEFIREAMPIIGDMKTYLTKALPDTRLTVNKYMGVKLQFLTYCLKVKDMEDEEAESLLLHAPLDRVLSGNYQYRVFLRCRHILANEFSAHRTAVLEKLKMLNERRVQDIALQLDRFVTAMDHYCHQGSIFQKGMDVYPIVQNAHDASTRASPSLLPACNSPIVSRSPTSQPSPSLTPLIQIDD